MLVLFVSLCWVDDCCHSPLSTTETPTDEGGGSRLSTKQVVSNGEGIRLAIFLVSAALVGSCAVITLVGISCKAPNSCLLILHASSADYDFQPCTTFFYICTI